MTIADFEQKKKLSKDEKYWFVKEKNKTYIRAVHPKDKKYGCPSYLKTFKDQIIWEIGPNGKKAMIGNLTIN